MNLKKCSCGRIITTKNKAKNLGRNELGLWLNCVCGSTILLPSIKYKIKN